MAESIRRYIEKLETSEPLRRGVISRIVSALGLPAGSRGLDAGCGVGLHLPLLAEAVGRRGAVIGLDIHQAMLRRARARVTAAGAAGRVELRRGDIHKLPFADGELDWLWSCDCAGHPWPGLEDLMRELARVVRPGGLVALATWSSQSLLPGYPQLEARLNASATGIAPFAAGMSPELHPQRALGWMARAGLRQTEARSFVEDIQAPVSPEVRRALACFFDMRWGGADSELTSQEWEQYLRLSEPSSPDFIADCGDFYGFFTYTVFLGRPGGSGGIPDSRQA